MKITILEFAPCADTIYHIRRDSQEGYLSGDRRTVTIKSGVKLRPRIVSVYAGGKATNVARVIDNLLKPEDQVEIELVVFRPDSPEGRYIHELQTSALTRARPRPVIIRGQARLCSDFIDPETDPDNRVEFNSSPRAFWKPDALDAAFEFVSKMETDLLLLAGNPPVIETTGEMAVEMYARIIEQVRAGVRVISVDVEKATLAACLNASAQPDVIKINGDEYGSVNEKLWDNFGGTLIVTDASGCLVTRAKGPSVRVQGVDVANLYSTIGAGDSTHAGFTLARWVRGFDDVEASRYAMAVAAATVSSPEGTRSISPQAVEQFFSELKRASH